MNDTDINIDKYKSLTVKDGSVYKVQSIGQDIVTMANKEGRAVVKLVGDGVARPFGVSDHRTNPCLPKLKH